VSDPRNDKVRFVVVCAFDQSLCGDALGVMYPTEANESLVGLLQHEIAGHAALGTKVILPAGENRSAHHYLHPDYGVEGPSLRVVPRARARRKILSNALDAGEQGVLSLARAARVVMRHKSPPACTFEELAATRAGLTALERFYRTLYVAEFPDPRRARIAREHAALLATQAGKLLRPE